VKALGILPRVEGEESRVDAAFAQGREQGEQVSLCAPDTLHLGRMEDLHRVRIST
jgi:hypothetical protein